MRAEQIKQRAGELARYLDANGFGSIYMCEPETTDILAILRAVAGGEVRRLATYTYTEHGGGAAITANHESFALVIQGGEDG